MNAVAMAAPALLQSSGAHCTSLSAKPSAPHLSPARVAHTCAPAFLLTLLDRHGHSLLILNLGDVE